MENSALRIFKADRALALEQDPMRECADLDAQIGPSHRRAQISPRRAAAPHVADCHLQRADAVLLRAVEVLVRRMSGLLSPGDKGVMQFVPGPQVGDRKRSTDAMMLIGP